MRGVVTAAIVNGALRGPELTELEFWRRAPEGPGSHTNDDVTVLKGVIVALVCHALLRETGLRAVRHAASTVADPMVFRDDRAFLRRTVVWAVVPLLAAVATQYPSVADFLSQLIDPVARTLR